LLKKGGISLKKTKFEETIKYLIVLFVGIVVGNIALEFLEKTPLNIWLARTIACSICVGVCSLFYHFWISKKEK